MRKDKKLSDQQSKKFEVLTISRDYLQSIGIHPCQVAGLTDEDMTQIAQILIAKLFDSEYDGEAKLTTHHVLAGKSGKS